MKLRRFCFPRSCLSPTAVIALLAALLLAGCASSGSSVPVEHRQAEGSAAATASSKDVYVVKKGDTLYAIALDHGVDYKDLVAWNGIDNPNRILVGQQLKLNGRGKAAAVTESNGVVVQPIGGGAVERRSLEGTPAPASVTSSSPAVAAPVASNAGGYKREPKAGKEPYSDAALARLSSSTAAAPAAPVSTPAAVVASAAKPEGKSETKPETKDTKPEAKAESTEPKTAATDDINWAWPANGKVLAGFGGSNKGIDFAGKQGDPVLAAADGKVAYIGTGIAALGKLVILRHNTNYLSAYAHNSSILVKEGQSVSRGQKIAEFGSSGTDSVKLHFEIRRQGTPVDPSQYLPKR